MWAKCINFSSEGATSYVIPSGGCNEIGTWGYIEAFRELMEQVRKSMIKIIGIRVYDLYTL